jgi:cytochrome c oxidase assembly factor 1
MISRWISLQNAARSSSASQSILRRPYHLSSLLLQSSRSAAIPPRSTYIPAPTDGSGPLLSRRPDRELPSLESSHIWLKTLPLFIALITVSSLAIFNYQKSSSSTVNSILYALRMNEASKQVLGDEIYFASKVPWISGELNQLHGKIDISFWVKGSKGKGKVRFASVRKRRNGFVSTPRSLPTSNANTMFQFETLDWSLQTENGTVIHLLDNLDGQDPFQKSTNT